MGKFVDYFSSAFGIAGAVEVLAGDVLRLGAVEVFEVGLREFCGAVFLRVLLDHRDRRLGEDADGRDDDLGLAGEFLLDQVGLVFP